MYFSCIVIVFFRIVCYNISVKIKKEEDGAVQILSLQNIPRSVSFCRIFGLTQYWNDERGNAWSCIGQPRPQHGFIYICCGEVCITDKNKKQTCFEKGNLVYLPAGSEYTIRFSGTSSGPSDVLINFDICDTHGRRYTLSDEIYCVCADLPAKIVNDMLTLAHASINVANPTLQLSMIFYDYINKLVHHLQAIRLNDCNSHSVLPAILYMDSHILDDFTIPQFAQLCLMSESAFRKAFRAQTGMNPVEYRTKIKIDKAKQLLRSLTDIPTEEIAAGLGFCDNAYFHKVFYRLAGMSPKQYRMKHLQKPEEKKTDEPPLA